MATNKVVTKVVADTSGHDSALRKSEAEVLRYSQRVKNANNEMRGLNTNLGKASSSMRTFIGSLGTGKIGSLTSSLQGLSSAFGGLDGNIGNITTSLAGMQGGLTSLINPYTAIAAAVVGGAVALFKFNENLDATTRKVQEFLGVSREVAMPIRNSIQAIADTYSVEFNDVLNSVDTLMNQFGIDANQALDIVKRGFAAGANENGNFLSLLRQYAPTFQDAGIGASQLAAYIAQTRSGIFNEDGLQLIATATRNIRNMSNSTRESLRDIGIDADDMIGKMNSGQMSIGQAISTISEKLSELNPQSQEVGAVLKDVFGKKGSEAGYKLVTALKDVDDNLTKVQEQTTGWGVLMSDLEDANEDLNDALVKAFGTAEGGIDLIVTKLKTLAIEALAKVLDIMSQIRDLFDDTLWKSERIPDKTLKHEAQGNTRVGNTWYDANGNVITDPNKQGNSVEKGEKTNSPKPNPTPKSTGGKSKSTPKKEELYDDTAELKVLKEKAKAMEKLNQILDKSIDKENQLADAVKRLNELLNSGKLSPRDQQKALDALTDYTAKLNEANAPLNKYRDNTNAMNDAIANATQTQKIFDSNSVETKASLTDVANAMGSIGGSLGSLGEAFKMPVLDAAGIIANAIATMIQGYATASAQAATLGPWAWIAFGMEGLAQLAMMISQINSMKFAEGGIVNGTRTIGDMNLARVNSGEMILNGKQQRNLFNIINSGALGGSDSNQTVHFRVSGNDLVGVLNNYNNKRSKAR